MPLVQALVFVERNKSFIKKTRRPHELTYDDAINSHYKQNRNIPSLCAGHTFEGYLENSLSRDTRNKTRERGAEKGRESSTLPRPIACKINCSLFKPQQIRKLQKHSVFPNKIILRTLVPKYTFPQHLLSYHLPRSLMKQHFYHKITQVNYYGTF